MNTVIEFSFAQVLTICGAIITLSTCVGVLGSWVKKAQEPNAKQNERLDRIEQRLDEHDKYFIKDRERFDDIERMMKLLIKSNRALLRHGIDGNTINELKLAEEDISNYLIEK